MPKVFLSYSRKDHHFAELAKIKLADDGIELWIDHGQLRAGREWQGDIEQAISESIAVVVALSENSAASSYVTYEWAYGLGQGKTIVPLRLAPCRTHPRLKAIQYLDFSIPGSLPWDRLIARIWEAEAEATPQKDLEAASAAEEPPQRDPTVQSILNYLTQRGYQMVSYERIRRRIDPELTDQALDALVDSNPSILRHAVLKEGKKGLAKLIP